MVKFGVNLYFVDICIFCSYYINKWILYPSLRMCIYLTFITTNENTIGMAPNRLESVHSK